MNLSTKQIKRLRILAHTLKPVVIIGQQGLGESVFIEIDQALQHHELIKVRINAEDRHARTSMIDAIGLKLKCGFVQRIGHVAIFYRLNPNRNRIRA